MWLQTTMRHSLKTSPLRLFRLDRGSRPATACGGPGSTRCLTAAIPKENPYCSCKLTRPGHPAVAPAAAVAAAAVRHPGGSAGAGLRRLCTRLCYASLGWESHPHAQLMRGVFGRHSASLVRSHLHSACRTPALPPPAPRILPLTPPAAMYKRMALITSDYGVMRSLSIKWL